MTAEIMVRRNGLTLVPVDDAAADAIEHLPAGRDFIITARTPRNPKHHRLAWALAQRLADACDWLHDREDAMDFLKLKAKHFKTIAKPNGDLVLIPKSISFGSMDQAAFNRLFNRMVWVVCNDIVPGIDEKSLREEIQKMVEPRHQQGARR